MKQHYVELSDLINWIPQVKLKDTYVMIYLEDSPEEEETPEKEETPEEEDSPEEEETLEEDTQQHPDHSQVGNSWEIPQ